MAEKRKTVTVPREEAVFWLDGRGNWHSPQGPFKHPKIILHFHASIRKDREGFHLAQDHRHFREKVYFPYEDTPLFVFDVKKSADDIILVLNTGSSLPVRPRSLFIRDDHLYMRMGRDRVKFTEQALIRISDRLEFQGEESFIRVKGRRYRISQQ